MDIYRTFITVVDEKNLSFAAKKLHRSPSAISKQISQLESRLETQLIDRTTRSLAVTEAGQRYYEHCHKILSQITEAETELADMTKTPTGVINVTLSKPTLYTPVMDVLGAFSREFDSIQLNMDTSTNVLDFTDDEIDIAFRLGAIQDIPMKAYKLFDAQPVFCAARELVDTLGPNPALPDILKLPLLLEKEINLFLKAKEMEMGPEIIDVMKVLENAKTHRSNCILTNMALIKSGAGAGILFQNMIEEELANGTLVKLELPGLSPPPLPVHMLYQHLNYQPRKIKALVDFVKSHFPKPE